MILSGPRQLAVEIVAENNLKGVLIIAISMMKHLKGLVYFYDFYNNYFYVGVVINLDSNIF